MTGMIEFIGNCPVELDEKRLTGEPISRERILDLEAQIKHMRAGEFDAEQGVKHWFAPGVYCRDMFLPTETVVVGKLHRHEHMNFLLHGTVLVASEFSTELFAAPRIWKSEAGIKRVVYTIEAALWTTVHANPDDETDVAVLEARLIAPDYETLDRENVRCLV